jgi:hypothetical protein
VATIAKGYVLKIKRRHVCSSTGCTSSYFFQAPRTGIILLGGAFYLRGKTSARNIDKRFFIPGKVVEMRKILATGLTIIFLTAQYSYTNAACELCAQSDEMIQPTGSTRPELPNVEYMFDQLGLNEKVELINPQDTFKLEHMDAEFIYVALYDSNSYLLARKEGNLIGAVNYYDGEMQIILPRTIQPELICLLVLYLIWGKSAISIIACLLLPLAVIFNDQGLFTALFSSCMNGFVGSFYPYQYFIWFCQ